MSFRNPTVSLLCCMTLLSLTLPGCSTCQTVRERISEWNLLPRRSVRRTTQHPVYPRQSYPKTACPNGPWPNCLPSQDASSEKRPDVVPAPEPVETAPTPDPDRNGDQDPLSAPLPPPPRLPTQAKAGRQRPVPRPQVAIEPEVERPVQDPEPVFDLSDEPTYSPQPESGYLPTPRIAERLEQPARSRQPVQLEAPETEQTVDPFDSQVEDLPALEGNRTPIEEFPQPAFVPSDEEDLELIPVPAPEPLDLEIKPQSLEIRRNQIRNQKTLQLQKFESYGLPAHSAMNSRRGLKPITF